MLAGQRRNSHLSVGVDEMTRVATAWSITPQPPVVSLVAQPHAKLVNDWSIWEGASDGQSECI